MSSIEITDRAAARSAVTRPSNPRVALLGGVLGLVLPALVGCGGETVRREDPASPSRVESPAGLEAAQAAASRLRTRLASLEGGRSGLVVAVVSLRNETRQSLDMGAYMDRIRTAIFEAGATMPLDSQRQAEFDESARYEQTSGDVDPKEALRPTQRPTRPRYVVLGRVKEIAKEGESTLVLTLELHDEVRREVVFMTSATVRTTRS